MVIVINSPKKNSRTFDNLFFIASIFIIFYFIVATFGFLGEVKDRSNYISTFENLNGIDNYWDIFFGSSIFYGLIFLLGISSHSLSFLSVVFLIIKIYLIKKIFKLWAFVFLYLIKFAFVIDLILLKESLSLLLVLLAFVLLNGMRRNIFLALAFFTHISSISLLFLFYNKIKFNKFFIFYLLFFSSVFLYLFLGVSELKYLHYFASKIEGYILNAEINDSFLIGNPIFWVGVILALYSVYQKKINPQILYTQFFSIIIGFLHPIVGVPAFRLWQFSSFVDLFSINHMQSIKVMILYMLPNFLFFIYGPIYLRNFVNQ
jgi:hypothetical protein